MREHISEQVLIKVLKVLTIASFFTPLIVVQSFIFPFIVPKVLFFRTIVLLMLGVYILLLMHNKTKYRVSITPLTITVFLFIISLSISTFTGVDWYKSFWDNHERMLGLFTLMHYALYFFIMGSVFRDKKDWIELFRWFMGVGITIVCTALWQKFIDPEALLNRNATRISATLGNAIYFSGYGLFLMVIGAVGALYKSQHKWWRIFFFVGAILGLLAVFLGGTRGTILGLLIGGYTGFFYFLLTFKEKKRVRTFALVAFVATLLIGGSLFVYKDTAVVQSIPGVNRLVNTSISSGSARTRIMAWDIAIEAWKEKPVFGWGPNNYYYAFNKYYKPEFLEHGIGETWFDNAHNILLNTLTVQGIVGFLLYFSIFVSALLVMYKSAKDNSMDHSVRTAILVFFIAHLISSIFVFENPTSYLYFFLILAFVNSHGVDTTSSVKKKEEIISMSAASLLIGSILLLIFTTNINPARANKQTLLSIKIASTDPALAYDVYQKAKSIPSPHHDDMRNDMSRTFLQAMTPLYKGGFLELSQQYYEEAEAGYKQNLLLHPMDIRVHMQIASLYLEHARLHNDPSKLLEAEQLLRDAIAYSPQRQQLAYQFSQLLSIMGKHADSISVLEETRDVLPSISETWARLISAYAMSGDMESAIKEHARAIEEGVIFSGIGKRIIDQYFPPTKTVEVAL